MQNDENDGLEFTDEQLRAALKRMGRDARKAAFSAGQPVIVVKGSSLVALYPDGSEKVIETLCRETGAVSESE